MLMCKNLLQIMDCKCGSIVLVTLAICVMVNGQCQSGELREYGYPEMPKWVVRRSHTFDLPFNGKPALTYGMVFLDGNYFENFRANVSVETLTEERVVFRLHTWHDSKLYGLGISWMACPGLQASFVNGK